MEVRDSQHLSGPSYSRLISPRESFGLQNNSSQSQSPAMQNMRLEFSSDGTPVYKPLTSQYTGGGAVGSGNGAAAPTFIQQGIGMSMEEPMKRKRGRPRKYEPDGKIAIPVTTVSQASAAVPHLGGSGFSSPTQSQSSMKKVRGRPPGSGKKHQMAALGAAGVGFTPHVITVKAGEDVSSKIISFSQHGARDICIMSANGAISNVTLRQAATTGGTVTYEGRFEILSLSGSFFMSEVDGQHSRTGGLSVSLAGSDGRVLGGGVAGLLTAASPVQIVVGSFVANGNRESTPINPSDPLSAPQKLATGGATGTHSPPSQGTPSESSGGSDSPRNQIAGVYGNNTPQSYGSMPWK